MKEKDKQQLIKLASKMFCVECGNRGHEYTTINKQETINNTTVTIPNVPVMRCKHCNAISYPSFAFEYIEQQINKMQLNP